MESENSSAEKRMSKVVVFTSPTCPHCPPTKKLVSEVASEKDDVEYEEMSTATPEGSRRAQELGIMSVPTIIITGPGSEQPIGLAGLPPRKGLEKAINISLGKDRFKEEKNKESKPLLKRIFGK